jgi:O-antigen ligase
MLELWVLIYLAALYIRPAEIVPALANVPVMDYVAAAAALTAAVSLVTNPRKFWDEPHDKFFLAYCLTIIVSNPASGWIGGGPAALINFSPAIVCYFLIRLGVRTPEQVRRLIRVLVCLNLMLAINGLLQIFAGTGIGQVAAMETREGVRIQGTGIFHDPNDLGMTLVMTLPFVVGTALSRGTRLIPRIVTFAALCIIVVACYYTNSRGTMLGLGVVLAVFVYRRFGFFSASVLAGIGLAAFLALGPSRMSTISAEEASAQGRIQAWAEGFRMFRSSPVFGIGYRRFGDYYTLVAHNSFVHVLAELGLAGALTFVGMFYYYFRGLRHSPDRLAPYAAVQLMLRNTLADSGLGLLTCMCFLSRQYVAIPFVLLATGASYASATRRPSSSSTLAEAASIVAITFALMVIFYLIGRLFTSY